MTQPLATALPTPAFDIATFGLPDAPMAMPQQVLEHPHGLLRRLLALIAPDHTDAPSAGARM